MLSQTLGTSEALPPLYDYAHVGSITYGPDLVEAKPHPTHTHLVYDQVHSGIPVFGARLGLHFDDRGELIRANGNLLSQWGGYSASTLAKDTRSD